MRLWWILFRARHLDRREEALYRWIAWRLPRKLVHWVNIRVMAHATCACWTNRNPLEISLSDAVVAWEVAPNGLTPDGQIPRPPVVATA